MGNTYRNHVNLDENAVHGLTKLLTIPYFMLHSRDVMSVKGPLSQRFTDFLFQMKEPSK